MEIATLDLETYWDSQHSLSKMSPIKYCMHPDTDIISCAFKFNNDKPEVVFGEQAVVAYAREVDWSKYWVVGHNMSEFDSMILAWRMGIKPKLWGCTLAMARPIHAKDIGLSLGALVAHYGLGVKNQSALIATKGKRLADFTRQEIADMKRYNADDADQCFGLLRRLMTQTRREELRLIDMTIRMLVEPQFIADVDLLSETYTQETERKEAVLRSLGDLLWNDAPTRAALRIQGDFDPDDPDEVKKVLMSASKFRTLLESLGVDVPMKTSPTTGKEIPALAKSDSEFLELREHENEMVAAAASARLDAKSTLLQTRIAAFIETAESYPENRMPIPLKYCGADTTGRWSGWGGMNFQNLNRVDPNNPKPSDALRNCLQAPEGHKVVVADQSGIELRVNHFLWQVPSSMKLFQADPAKADLYKDFASDMYNVRYEDVIKPQRQVGKVAHLGLGFGAGGPTFQKFAKTMGGVNLTLDEAYNVVQAWRSKYPEIVRGWKTCHRALPVIMREAEGAALDPWGMIIPVPGGLKTPKGMIRYPDLREEQDDEGNWEYVYGNGRRKARIYAGKIDENIVQHLARQVIADNALEVQRRTGYRAALTVHDELVYIAPDHEAEWLLGVVQKVMRTPPDWWPELLTWSEGDIAQTYGAAK